MDKFFKAFTAAMALSALTACANTHDNQLVPNRIYTNTESEEPLKPCIIIEENNKFQFVFSAVSSYIGVGTYIVDGNTVILNTDDGDYHYTFTIKDNTLIFDAENSSENTWFSNLNNGAVFN